MKKFFENRTAGFYIGLAASCIALVGAVLLLLIAGNDLTFSLPAFILLVCGGLSYGLVIFKEFKFAPMIPALLIALGTALHLEKGIPSVTDIINDIVYIGGNGWYCIYFGIVFLVATVLACVACYMREKKAL